MAFPFKGGRLIQVKITKTDKHVTAAGWPRPLNRGGRLIQVPNTEFVCAKNRDFKKWPLNRGWPLDTGPLYTGSTVPLFLFFSMGLINQTKKRAATHFHYYNTLRT